MIDTETILAMLEKDCERCGTTGRIQYLSSGYLTSTYEITCPVCNGARKILTDLGREVIGFVQRHISTPVIR